MNKKEDKKIKPRIINDYKIIKKKSKIGFVFELLEKLSLIILLGLIFFSMFNIDTAFRDLKGNNIIINNYLLDFIEENGFKNVEVEIMDDYNYSDSKILGLYDNNQDKIFVNSKIKNTPQLIEVLFHEYGHHIYYKILTIQEKDEYNIIYLNQTNYTTSYSINGGVLEDFSESYSVWKTKNLATKDKDKYFNRLEIKYGTITI